MPVPIPHGDGIMASESAACLVCKQTFIPLEFERKFFFRQFASRIVGGRSQQTGG